MKRSKKLYIILIVTGFVIFAVFSYIVISRIYTAFLITQPILTDYNESDRQILQEELGIKFVKDTVIIKSRYSPGVDPSFEIVFTFSEEKNDEFCEGITDNYIYESYCNQLVTSGSLGDFVGRYRHRTRAFTSLDIYKTDSNTVNVYIIYDSPNGRLKGLLMDQVR